MKISQLLHEFYEKNGIPLNGGVNDVIAPISLGFIKFKIYNPTWRRKVIHIHDIEHVLYDCDTSWKGEAFIAGYEIGVDFWKVFPVCLFVFFAMGYSLWLYPRQVWKGFVEGLQNENLLNLKLEKEALLKLEKTTIEARIKKTQRVQVTIYQKLKFLLFSILSQILLLFPLLFFVILFYSLWLK